MFKSWLLLLMVFTCSLTAQNLVINEVMSSNQKTIYDEDGESSDWLEIFNGGTVQINLTGYALSDDTLQTKKWIFGNTTINPGEHLIVFASGKNRKGTKLHTNFNINADGETLIFSNAQGVLINKIKVPALTPDISYGRTSDGSSNWMLQIPTPGTANTGKVKPPEADKITASIPGGFYSSQVRITLTAGTSNIYYTLDGKDPDTTSAKYTAPIIISKTTALKAISKKPGFSKSETLYQTYFINETTILPVVSLTSDPYNLFDYNYGIYANGPGWTAANPNFGANFWKDWERPAHIEFFDDSKNPGFSYDCSIAIYGAWTRANAQKSFSVKFKDLPNSTGINYKLFPDLKYTNYTSFLLRNAGNDFQYLHFRDAMMQYLIRDLDIDYLEYRPATTFLNGEYWGIYNLREKINENYIAQHHGVNPDNIDLLEGNMSVIQGDSLHYLQLIKYIQNNDMTTDASYNYVTKMIDLDECLLYFAAQAYYNNQDWPANNIKFWRERSETGKWRWILYDLDFGFNLYESTGQSEDHVYYIFSGIETRKDSNPPWSTLLPRKLVENPRIKNQFINLVADLLNTKFVSTRVVNTINQMAAHIAGDIARHRTRFGVQGENLNRVTSFANERPAYLRTFMRNFFKCGNDASITLNSTAGGKIKLNSLLFNSSSLPWTGKYFESNAITLKAIPEPGYKFDGWTGVVNSTEATITLNISRAVNLSASFSVDKTTSNKIIINEINYNSSKDFNPGDWVELYNPGSSTVDLSNWVFRDSDPAHKFILPAGTKLEPNQYLVLVDDDANFAFLFPQVKNFVAKIGFGLDGNGEYMQLTDEAGQIIDSLTYKDKSPWPTTPDGNGATLELVDASSDNSIGSSWKGSSGHGSPGKINSVTTSINFEEKQIIPDNYFLKQNYPNPFNPLTVIEYAVPKNCFVTIKLYDALGKELKTLLSEEKIPGNYSLRVDGSDLASGIYFYTLHADNFSSSKKMILVK